MGLAQQMRQKQVLAPQIRQSLEVLQLQVQDLCALANQELQRNPALEEVSVEKTSVDEEREKFEKEDYAGDDGKMNGSEELEENDGEAHSSGEEYVYGEELMRVAVAEESGVGPESAAESHDTYEAVPREEAVEHDVAHDEAAGSWQSSMITITSTRRAATTNTTPIWRKGASSCSIRSRSMKRFRSTSLNSWIFPDWMAWTPSWPSR